MSKIACDIVHLQDRVYQDDDCSMIVVPGKDGEMGFMEGHVPVLAKLTDGAVRLHMQDNSVKTFATQGGYVYCTGDNVLVLTDRACAVEDIDNDALVTEEAELNEKLSTLAEDDIRRKVTARKIRWVNIRRKVKQEAGSLV